MAKLTAEQKADIINKYKSGDKEGAIAMTKEIANGTTPTSTPTNTPTNTLTTPTTPTVAETPTVESPTPTQETPTTPTTPTPKANETPVSTVSEVKQEGVLKPLSQEYYNQTSQEAQDKIVSNLNGYRQTNPEYFSSYEDFKKNFSYDSRNEQQKNTLDQWYKGYTKGMELSGLPVTDLYTQWKDGTISNSDLENLRISNPGKYAELQNTINKGNIIAAYDDDTGGTETGMSIQDMAYQMMVQTFNQYMNGDSSSGASEYFREYEEKMNDPEMKGLSDQCTEVQEQMENIQSDLDAIKKTVEAEYEGTGASRAKINAIISDRSYDLQLQLRTLNSEYNKYATQYNNRMNQYQNEFNLQLQEYQLQQNERQMQMKELGFAMDLMSFETPQQAQEREWNYWVKQQEYANGNINSKDYQTRYKAALKSVENLLSQYEGIPMVRSAEQMAQDVLKAIDNGSDLGTELTKINQQIQNKPEYKYLYNNTFNPTATSTTSTSLIQDSMKIGDTEWVKYNDKRYTADEFNKFLAGEGMTQGTAKPYDLVDESVFSASIAPHYINDKGDIESTGKNLGKFLMRKLNGQEGGQCGKYVNDYLQFIGMTGAANRYYDNELSTKLNSINSYNPKVGTIAVFDYNHKSSDGINHGHVGIVTKVYADGSFEVRDSNYSGDEKIKTRHISGDEALRGFFDPSKPPMNTEITTSNNFVSGSIDGVPLAYERAVKNLVPAALQNSDAEREALNKVITNSYNGGIDQSQIALTFMGFDIRNDDDKNLALDLVNTVRTLSTDTQEGIVQTISDLMNQGNYAKAIQTVENAVSQQAKADGNYVSESSVKNTINKANELSTYMSGLKKDPTGVLEGTMQEWLGKLASKDAKEISNRIALIESSLDIKDKELLQKIVPQLSDQPSVFMSKLNNLGDNAMLELNGWRTIYGLPSLTQDAVINHSNRVDLYRNGDTSSTKNTSRQNNTTQTQSNTVTKNDMSNAIRALNLKYGLK